MKDRYTGKSRGFGFVSFQFVEDASRVISTEHHIDGAFPLQCAASAARPMPHCRFAQYACMCSCHKPHIERFMHFTAISRQIAEPCETLVGEVSNLLTAQTRGDVQGGGARRS